MYGALELSTSGLIAQRTRLEVITSNINHQYTCADSTGKNNPYKRKVVQFAPGDPTAETPEARRLGVHASRIDEVDSFTMKWDPGNSLADVNGYVKYPDIDPVYEEMNAWEAQRAYEANLVVAEATKAMVGQALRLIA